MNILQSALARVARKVRLDPLLRRDKRAALPTRDASPAPAPPSPSNNRASASKLQASSAQSGNLRRLIFQNFLRPLDMPRLRIYDDTITYETDRAEANLAAKQRKDNTGLLSTYLTEKSAFTRMLDLLVARTPAHLKDSQSIKSPGELALVLEKEHLDYMSHRYVNVPKYSFGEVPPMPEPLTKETFREYIYTLTQCTFPYRNSSSLTSGIIPEILLYTHHLENDSFKPYRSVETFNYLIAYFGYNKFQNYFARGLLLVMAKDGHTPNTHTINELLKICRIHSKKRHIVSTYLVVTNYLNLAEKLNIPANLTTWNRLYDCIDNILFKETFINRMMLVNLPVLENMCVRILADYCLTCTNTGEAIGFVENDLRRPFWKKDPRLAERVLHYAVANAKSDKELQTVIDGLFNEIAIDGLSLKQIANALQGSRKLSLPSLHLLYIHLSLDVEKLPENYVALIKGLCADLKNYNIHKAALVLRGIINDACIDLRLPLDPEDIKESEKKVSTFPFPIPTISGCERYRILKRLTQTNLIDFEAAVIFANNTQDTKIAMPWKALSDDELAEWVTLKLQLATLNNVHANIRQIAADIGLLPAGPRIPDEIVHWYQRMNYSAMGHTTELRLLNRLENGFDKEFLDELKERGILNDCM